LTAVPCPAFLERRVFTGRTDESKKLVKGPYAGEKSGSISNRDPETGAIRDYRDICRWYADYEGVLRPALPLDGSCVRVGAYVEGRAPSRAPVPGDHVAPGALEPHDSGAGELHVSLWGLVYAHVAAEAAELVRDGVAEGVVVQAGRHLGVYPDEFPEVPDHLVPPLLYVGEYPLLWV